VTSGAVAVRSTWGTQALTALTSTLQTAFDTQGSTAFEMVVCDFVLLQDSAWC